MSDPCWNPACSPAAESVPTRRGRRDAGFRPAPWWLSFLPAGRPLTAAAFELRHRGLLLVLWAHVPVLVAVALATGVGPGQTLVAAAGLAAVAVVATTGADPRLRSIAVALGLAASSGLVVHLWDGAPEAYFHFLVVMTLLALYQSWLPFLVALAVVVLTYVGVAAAEAAGLADRGGSEHKPVSWALVYGAFVLASCVGNLLAWRLVEDEATTDGLTGLANRTLFLDRLQSRLASGDRPTSVLFLDLDGFKTANHGFGSDVGDRLLVAVAARLRGRLREGDLLARFGGDEFAVVLTAPGPADAQSAADRLLGVFDDPFRIGELRIDTSASAGVATACSGSTPATLLRDADLAMNASKRAGGNRCTAFAPSMHAAAIHRSGIINDFPRALRDGEFVVHYQPVVSIAGGETVGVEALVRWDDPERGLVLPGDFIQAAEESGFIVDLGRHVLRTACEQGALWRAAYPDHPELVISVNLSPRQLAEVGLVDMIADVLAKTGLSPGQLCLEVTEGAVIRDLAETIPRLSALAAVGIRLALDDFGTGYSSLAYLQRMPVHVLKVDGSFVAALRDGAAGTAIVRAVVELAHQLGLTVTAEGIETREQHQVLASLACDTGQGYLHARPCSAEEMTALLRAERGASPTGVPGAQRRGGDPGRQRRG